MTNASNVAEAAKTVKPVSGFKFSNTSLLRLTGVNPKLVSVIKRALELSDLDFTVLEGLRTKERQAQLVKAGASETMNSRHIVAQATDIAPVIGGVVSWDWNCYYGLARAVQAAAIELGVTITWGGVWDKHLNDLSTNLSKEVADYCARHKGADFIDGPHFQIEL
jgi:peptidoglycan L-alanyl-D-glutamate endopeptidase CwlK